MEFDVSLELWWQKVAFSKMIAVLLNSPFAVRKNGSFRLDKQERKGKFKKTQSIYFQFIICLAYILLQKQLVQEVQNRDETINKLKEDLSKVEADLKRVMISSGMQDLTPNEQIEKYQERLKTEKYQNFKAV